MTSRPALVRARESATYACPSANMLAKLTFTQSRLMPWLLWTVTAQAESKGTCEIQQLCNFRGCMSDGVLPSRSMVSRKGVAVGAWLHNLLLDVMRKVPMAVHQDCSCSQHHGGILLFEDRARRLWHVTAADLSSTPLLQHHCMGCLVANITASKSRDRCGALSGGMPGGAGIFPSLRTLL